MNKMNEAGYGVCLDPISAEEILAISMDAVAADKWLEAQYAKLKSSVRDRLNARDTLVKRMLVKLTEAGFTGSQGYGLDDCKKPDSVKFFKDRVSIEWKVSSCQAGWISGVYIEANYKIFSMSSQQLADMNRAGELGHLITYREIEP